MKIMERKTAAKDDDFLTTVARSIGSTLGARRRKGQCNDAPVASSPLRTRAHSQARFCFAHEPPRLRHSFEADQ